MTEPRSNSSSNGFLYFVVGALVVAVGVLGFMYMGPQSSTESSIERSAEAVGDAAEDVGESAEDVADAANEG